MSTLNHPFFIALSMIFTLILATVGEILSPDDPHSSPARPFYYVLTSNGLPMGIFPKGISDFSLDPASGRFELHLLLPSLCDTKFETHFRYTFNINGFANYGKIANLSGVTAQELFLWLPVKGIQVDVPRSRLIYFDIGVVFKQFLLSFFLRSLRIVMLLRRGTNEEMKSFSLMIMGELLRMNLKLCGEKLL